VTGPLAGFHVVEIATEISGPYAAKLFVDLGAEVTKIELPAGDPLRDWGSGGLFEYLNAGKRIAPLQDAGELIARADVLIENLGPGALEALGFDVERLVLLRISHFGQSGPWRDRPATSLTLQAASGWVNARDPDRPPVQVGARIAEYVAGGYGALGALTALRLASDQVVQVDVSVLESLLCTLPYPMLMAKRMRSLGLPSNVRSGPMLGVVQAADGWVGINCLTGQHWLDVCDMLGLPEYSEQQIAIMTGGPERAEFFAKAEALLAKQTVAEIVELSQSLRIPATPVNDGATVLDCPQYAEREFFAEQAGFRRPGPPFRLGSAAANRTTLRDRGPKIAVPFGSRTELPFAGLKVLDLSTFWAGAYLTCYLGAFGADIVKVESIQRPDGFRYSGAFPFEGDDWYERSAIWQATNLNKRDLTLDLTSERGRAIVRRLAAQADVVVENFSPRVVENFGLDYPSLAALKPDVIMLRMPGFGLQGPWRDYVGWALNFEQTAGMSAVTGYPDGPPCNPQGPADPIVGVHAGVALLAALEHRRRTGEGQLIEIAQIEVAACLTAEPVIEYSLNGVVSQRAGNRQRGYLQGVYPTNEDEVWVALSVPDNGLVDHDVFDRLVTGWTRTQSCQAIVESLRARGVPVERVITGDQMYDIPQLDARGFYEEFKRPISGAHRFPGWPFRITPGPDRHHRTAAPTLGQHNDEILCGLGLSDDHVAALRDERVIGERALNA
jgi:crotonobetainyl-CoA:carnitine CoA-transferase CaiB-like acyl-CoA transferase